MKNIKKIDIKYELNKSIKALHGINGDISDISNIINVSQESGLLETKIISLLEIPEWNFDNKTGNFIHSSGKFFSYRACKSGSKVSPIISQPEIGILGFLSGFFDDTLHFLVQLKNEPGNPNGIQLSPTVQATKSNYSQVHGGKIPKFLDYFLPGHNNVVLNDQYQSEQGRRYFQKRNRNTIIITQTPPDQDKSHIWMTLGQIYNFSEKPLLINSCARSVLSMLASSQIKDYKSTPFFSKKAINSKFLDFKDRFCTANELVSLNIIDNWKIKDGAYSDFSNKNFKIIGVEISGKGREVSNWSQPLLKEYSKGEYGLLIGTINNVPHIFWKFRDEFGLIDNVEIGPSWINRSEQDETSSWSYDYSSKGKLLVDIELAEEGGRFYQSTFAHKIIDIGELSSEINDSTIIPLTINQTEELMTRSGYFTIEARSLWFLMRDKYFV